MQKQMQVQVQIDTGPVCCSHVHGLHGLTLIHVGLITVRFCWYERGRARRLGQWGWASEPPGYFISLSVSRGLLLGRGRDGM